MAMAVGCPAVAQRIDLSTTSANPRIWTMTEFTHGNPVTKRPRAIGLTPYGTFPGYTIPFKNNDGYWYADITFKISRLFKKPKLHIKALG